MNFIFLTLKIFGFVLNCLGAAIFLCTGILFGAWLNVVLGLVWAILIYFGYFWSDEHFSTLWRRS